MISYPPPVFEQQKSEILQRYRILRGDSAHDAVCLADTMAVALRVPFVYVALYKRYRERYRCAHGLEAYSAEAIETYLARVHLAQSVFQVPDIESEEFFTVEEHIKDLPKVKSLAGIPLADPHGKKFGTLCIADSSAREFTDEDLQLLSGFARVVSNDICVRSAAHYAVGDLMRLEEEKCELFDLATVDPLTKALNRRSFDRFAAREFARFQRDNSQIATLMLDIDHFKSVNDQHGHAIGDQVIAKLVSVITNCVRQEDLVGRLGGEEFAIVLVEANASNANCVANRIRNAVKQVSFPSPNGPFSITCSIGISEPAACDEDITWSLQRSDEALYEAKETGRDRAITHLKSGAAFHEECITNFAGVCTLHQRRPEKAHPC